jgi:5-methylcytosine-specific restriction endonuclease McrA
MAYKNSIERLERLIQSNRDKIERLSNEIQDLDHAIIAAKHLEQRILELRKEQKQLPDRWVGWLRFVGGAAAAKARARNEQIGREFREIERKQQQTRTSQSLEWERKNKEQQRTKLEQYNIVNAAQIKSYVESAANEERELREWQAKEAQRAQKEAMKRKKRELERAKLAQIDGKSRDLSQKVKRKLRKPDICPYCGREITNAPHADHIFPLKYGGMSITENMVFVCSDCNTNKGDMTLREFCRKYGHDFQEIEKRLEKLGKKF